MVYSLVILLIHKNFKKDFIISNKEKVINFILFKIDDNYKKYKQFEENRIEINLKVSNYVQNNIYNNSIIQKGGNKYYNKYLKYKLKYINY